MRYVGICFACFCILSCSLPISGQTVLEVSGRQTLVSQGGDGATTVEYSVPKCLVASEENETIVVKTKTTESSLSAFDIVAGIFKVIIDILF